MIKPFSQACANNGPPILNQLQRLLTAPCSVLEIGSGTGQHSVFFSQAMPHIQWQPSDVEENCPGIQQWVDEAGLSNVRSPIALDISQPLSLSTTYHSVFMANTLHIFSWSLVERCFACIPQLLKPHGLLLVYGPFNVEGQFTSDSNARFDQWLKAADPERGIRDMERVNKLAADQQLILLEDNPMPANNRLLVWQYQG